MFRSIRIAVIVAFLWPLMVSAAEVPGVVNRLKKLHEERLEKLEKELNDMKEKLSEVATDREKRRAVRQQVIEAEKKLEAARQEGLLEGVPVLGKLSVGKIGWLQWEAESYRTKPWELKVLNVLGKDKMLVLPRWYVPDTGSRGPVEAGTMRDAQLRYEYMQPSKMKTGRPLMIYGWPTDGIVDDRVLDSSRGLFEVIGKEQYESVGGSTKTVFKLEWYDIETLKPYMKDHAKEEGVENPAENRTQGTRTWTDSTGKFTVEAEFRGMIFGEVRLKKTSGEVISVPIERLSKADREWIGRQSRE